MISTVSLTANASTVITVIVVVGTIIMLAVRELADVSQKTFSKFLESYLETYAVPLLILSAFIIVVDVARTIA